jgi:hypothetical protein
VQLVARGLRLRGLSLLYLEKRVEADAAFVAASFLEPEWSPGIDEWPPEARLAYADAVASSRRRGPGVLSVRVEPSFATLYVDGRQAAVGPATLPDLAPGQHALLATAPGHAPLAALIEIAGDGKLDDTSLFLEKIGAGADPGGLVAALAADFGGKGERAIASALAGRRSVEALVIVTDGVAWVLGGEGERRGTSLVVQPEPVRARILGDEILATEPPSPAEPWYTSPWAIGGAGAVVVAGASVGLYFLLRDEPVAPVRYNLGKP